MKKILYIFAALAAFSCAGTIDDDDNTGDIPDEYTEPFTLSVDKAEVEADGKDFVTFSLKDAYEREMLTDKNALQSVNILSDSGIHVKRMTTTATFIANGTHKFHATFKGKESENEVTVEARNRGKYEKYHRNVGLFKCTSVWCVACPALAENLHGLSDETKDHAVVVAFHGNFNDKDPFSLYLSDGTDLGSYVLGYFGGSGWPTLVYDLDKVATGAATTSDLETQIMARRVDYPATCGIKVNSVTLEGTSLKVSASLKSAVGGDYDLACAVLRDGLKYSGGYSVEDKGVYDEVAVALSESFLGYYQGEKVDADEEVTEVFSFDFGENVPSEAELNTFYVAVYANRKTADGSVMDNIVTCGYGENIDYRLND